MKGFVTSGMKKGSSFISLPRYATQIRECLGVNPYPGTLNVVVDTTIIDELKNIQGAVLHGFENKGITYGDVVCFPVQISTINAYALLPNKSTYNNVLELIAEECLMDTCGFTDGDVVELRFLPFLTHSRKMAVWAKPSIGQEIAPITIFYDTICDAGNRDLCTYEQQKNTKNGLPVYKKTIPERVVASHIFFELAHDAYSELEEFLFTHALLRMAPPRQIIYGILSEWQIEVKVSPK